MDEGVTSLRMESTSVVLAVEMARSDALDLLEWHESKVLTELVREVHKAGRVGTGWPTVTREPMVWAPQKGGPWRPAEQGEKPTDWRVTATVMAVPRG